MSEISITTYQEILHDFERGLYAEYNESMVQEYHDEEKDRDVLISTRNDGYELAELAVEIFDSQGDEHYLPEELWRYMRQYAERALLEADKEARSEAEHVKHLWRTAYA